VPIKLGALLLSVLFARFLLSWLHGLELHFDEAQYWTWSRHLDWSYATKGPLLAWLIALSTFLFGHSEWAVRLPAWLAYCAWLVVLFYFARQVWRDDLAGWWAVALGLTTPVYFLLGQVMSSDVFLFLTWTVALWAAYYALYQNQPIAWLGFGAAIGVGALGKLSIGLLPFFLGFYLLATLEGRAALRSAYPWAGGVILLLCMLPVLGWNAQHDWMMFRHEAGHIGDDSPVAQAYHWQDLGLFWVGQWLVLGIVMPLVAANYWLLPPRRAALRMLWWVSVLTLAFFAAKSWAGKVQPNWPAPAFIGLLVLFAGQITTLRPWQRWGLYSGFGLSFLAMILLLNAHWFGYHGAHHPLKKLHAWRAPIHALAAQKPAAQFVVTSYYPLAAELAFYWPHRIPVYLAADTARRFTQFDLWPSVNEQVGQAGLYIDTQENLPQALRDHCTPLPPVEARTAGHLVRTLFAWHCPHWPAIAWPTPTWH